MIIRKPEEGSEVRPGMEASPEEARMIYFWTWFNVLTIGLVDVAKADAVHHDEEMRREEADIELNLRTLESALACLRTMREAAYAFVKEDAKSGTKWSLRQKETWQKETKQTIVELADIGLYFHCYPPCSVNSLHLHIVDLSEVGPTYEACRFKNLSMDMVLEALDKEMKVFRAKRTIKMATGHKHRQGL